MRDGPITRPKPRLPTIFRPTCSSPISQGTVEWDITHGNMLPYRVLVVASLCWYHFSKFSITFYMNYIKVEWWILIQPWHVTYQFSVFFLN